MIEQDRVYEALDAKLPTEIREADRNPLVCEAPKDIVRTIVTTYAPRRKSDVRATLTVYFDKLDRERVVEFYVTRLMP